MALRRSTDRIIRLSSGWDVSRLALFPYISGQGDVNTVAGREANVPDGKICATAFHTSSYRARNDGMTDPSWFFAPRTTPTNTILRIVPQQTAYVVERFGRFNRILTPGLHVLIPFVERISYAHSLKETTIPVPNQTAITKDNVSLTIDGVLYVKVVDPYSASYGVENALYAVTQLAQTTMRSELGKITLDVVFAERDSLNQSIVESIQPAASAWGLQVLRYEIRDVLPPTGVRQAMELQAEAERRKRAQVLESEGQRQSKINIAEGKRAEVILASEASQQDQINRATGEAEAIYRRADATAQSIRLLAEAIRNSGGSEAVSLRIAEQYLDAFAEIAKKGNTMLLPASMNNPASMIGQALGIFGAVSGKGIENLHGKSGEDDTANESTQQDRESSAGNKKQTQSSVPRQLGTMDAPRFEPKSDYEAPSGFSLRKQI